MTSLNGRVALVTGVSRRVGIAFAIAERLHQLGATVYASGWPAHDTEMPWGADVAGANSGVTGEWFGEHRDLEQPDAPGALIDAVRQRFGALDIVIATHARSSSGTLADVTAEELDRSWAANVRSIVLLAQHLAAQHEPERPGGRMIWFTSGQQIQPMPNEMVYAITKGALAAMTQTIAVPLSEVGIAANCINPGPVDTGWADADTHSAVSGMFPSGRWGSVADVANLVEFLVSDSGEWIHGQVINSEGGFRRI